MGVISAVFLLGCHESEQSAGKQEDQGSEQLAAVQKDIREHLPIGSSRAEVAAYLDERKIPHSHIGTVKEVPDQSNQENALIRGESKGIVRSDIDIQFKFDETDSKLVSYSVQQIQTGP